MIQVTRLDGSQLYVNAELVEFVESTPDTVLSLTTGRKISIRESAETVVEAILSYKHRIQAGRLVAAPAPVVEPGAAAASSAED
jgi:flagellar protein FlbD